MGVHPPGSSSPAPPSPASNGALAHGLRHSADPARRAFRPARRLDGRVLLGLGAGALSLALLALGLRLVLPESQSLLEATRDLQPGATLQADDVTSVDVQVPPSVIRASFPSEAIDQVVGRRLGTRVAAGQLLAPSQLQDGHTSVAPGRVQDYRWLLDADPQVGLFLRSDYRRRHKDARLKLAELLANGPESGLNRAEELYSGLCAEDPENEQLWTALFRIHERTGSSLGLKSAVRRLRAALAELEAVDVADVDSVPLPPNLDQLVRDIQAPIDGGATPVA